MQITDQTFLDYLDNQLSDDEIKNFEDYLSKNIEAKFKLEEFKRIDQKIDNAFNDPKISEFKIPKELSNDYKELLENIDQYKKKNFENLGENVSKSRAVNQSINIKNEGFFKRNFNWLFPINLSQSLAFAVLALAYVLLPINMNTQVAKNESKEDLFIQFAKITEMKDFIPISTSGSSKVIKFNNIAFNIKDVTLSGTTRGSVVAAENDLFCPKDKDSKSIERSPSENPLDKTVFTYCGNKSENKWELLSIEIPKDRKKLNLSGKYKMLIENKSIYLFPDTDK